MSHPIARRAGMLALTAAMLMPSAGALSDVSSWAQEALPLRRMPVWHLRPCPTVPLPALSPAQSSVPLR